ncbi:MAG: VOC family protein [Gammaproteobacteria bacterium]|nr:VOC family protein [Gammaproteobacteria bacterium]
MKLAGITLPSSNLEKSLEFYRDVVKFDVFVVQENAAFLTTGSAPLAIYRAGSDSDMDASGHGLFINVSVNDIEELKRRLAAFGTAPIKEWEEGSEIHVLVADPDQNRVEFECPMVT